eukprot:Gregarina_sp_Poly_1__5489@NODE_28_length_19636_cov_263_287087_g25_i0_p3_GENE_NODE_28_length_19636_cov_263_287087_g25_i0NODE_28_length_19636_cov_263_287087_g25_i0_p3_ORF_typecomplete_len708_score73_30RabGAPTBC/PF00566_18/5_7e14TLD/PF07534_16/0_0034_NODE_28_length_19636_cov_263_287087_g25_i053457468
MSSFGKRAQRPRPTQQRRSRAKSESHCTFWRCTRQNPGESSSDEREEFGTSRNKTPRSRIKSPRSARHSPGNRNSLDDRIRFVQLVNSFVPTSLANHKVYSSLRWQIIEHDERDTWTPQLALLAIEGTQAEVITGLQTAIRRGIPDGLKSYVIARSHNAEEFLALHKGYVEKTYEHVFGKKPPDFSEGRVPTFSGGFEGTEVDFREKSGKPEEEFWGMEVVSSPNKVNHKGTGHSMSRMRLKSARSISWDNLDNVLNPGAQYSRRKSSSHTPPVVTAHDFTQRTLEALASRQLSFHQYNLGTRSFMTSSGPQYNHSVARLTMTGTASPMGSTDDFTLKKVTPLYQLLSPVGQISAKKILWAINNLFPQIEFAPVLAPLACILLCYVTESVTFVTMIKLLEKSSELLRTNASRPFLTFRRSEYVRFVKMAMAFAESHLPDLTTHLASLKVDLAAWFARTLQDGFARLLPFDLLLRIYLPFLFEGNKVFLRYALALLKTEEEELLCCATAEEANLTLLFREYRHADPDLVNDLTKLAYRFQIRSNNEPLSKFTSHDVPTPYLKTARMQKFYRPRLHDESAVIQDEHWEVIWRWLPSSARILDPILKFTTAKNGHSIKAIQRVLWDEDDKPMVFFMSTRSKEILGGICPFPFRTDAKSFGPESDLSGASVFQLAPHQVCFNFSGSARALMDVSDLFLLKFFLICRRPDCR